MLEFGAGSTGLEIVLEPAAAVPAHSDRPAGRILDRHGQRYGDDARHRPSACADRLFFASAIALDDHSGAHIEKIAFEGAAHFALVLGAILVWRAPR